MAVEEEVVKSTPSSSPFPFTPLLLLSPPFLVSSEPQIAFLEVLFITLGNLSWFNISFGFLSTVEGPISATTCRPQPWIYPLLEVLEFFFFFFFKSDLHFKKLHNHTRNSTVIWASSALLYSTISRFHIRPPCSCK
jgi:hypothetical protein